MKSRDYAACCLWFCGLPALAAGLSRDLVWLIAGAACWLAVFGFIAGTFFGISVSETEGGSE